MNFKDRGYDNWLQTNQAEEDAARYEAALEKKAEQIRAELSPIEWWPTMEDVLIIKPEFTAAMHCIICGNFEAGAATVKAMADKWLDNQAYLMAVDALDEEDD